MTEIEEYLELVKKRREEKPVLSLAMPSGATWRYHPVNLQQYAVSGRLPMHLVAKLQTVKNAPQMPVTEAEMLELGMSAMEITRDVMLNNLVFPRIGLEEKEGHILPEQIDPEDFEFFMQFIMRGAQADANPKSQPALNKRKRAA